MKRALLVFLLLFGCNDSSTVTGPTPAAPPPPSTSSVPVPTPVAPGPTFSWDNVRGVLLFAGTQGSESQILAVHKDFTNAWPDKQIVYNVCSETDRWEGTPWADGPAARSKESLDNLKRFLKVTAEAGAMVRLNIYCTVRDDKKWMNNHQEEYTAIVAKIAKDFDHVFLSIANEPYHPNSWFRGRDERIRNVRDTARRAGFQGPMGADDNLGCPDPDVCNFRYAYRSLGFVPDFHPYRNPDPGPGSLRALVEANGLPLIISEPTAYSSWRDGRCCTDNKEKILSYFRRAEREGITMFFHSTFGLEFPQTQTLPDWIPRP